MAGNSGKSVVQKLGIKPGFCILVDGAPSAYGELVGSLPPGVKITTRPKPPPHMMHEFATQAAGLASKLRSYRAAVAGDAMI
jgi:hypothetical protein